MDLPPPLTPAEAAQALGVKERWLRAQAYAGRVPHHRPHPKLLQFTPEDITAIRASWAKSPAEQPDELTTPRSRKRSAA